MAKYVYKGRTVTGGNGEGQALKADAFYPLVSIGKKELKTGLNGNWMNSDPAIGAVSLKGRVLFVNSAASDGFSESVLNTALSKGVAPLAILFAKKADVRIAGMAICSALSAEKGLIVVDSLGDKIFDFVADGDKVLIKEDGTVIVEKITALSV